MQQVLVVAAMLVAGAAAARYSQGSLRRNGNIREPVMEEWIMPTPKPFPRAYNVAPNRCPTGILRVGCIYDTQTVQRRWYHEHIPKEDRLPMTPELCFNFCKNASGAQYFALRGGDKCYCTPFFTNTNKGGRGDCDMPCVGDQTRICGGEQMVEVYDMHDCKNLPAYPCKRPPQAPEHARVFNSSYYRHTTTPCANAQRQPLTTENSHCEIECEEGYELVSNDLVCSERGNPLVYAWGQIEGSASCRPQSCGNPPEVDHSIFDHAEVFFTDVVDYGCLPGFTKDGEPTGLEHLSTECKAKGEIVKPGDCKRVSCGECPTEGPFAHAAPVQTGERVFQDWCNYNCDTGYSLNQAAVGQKSFKTQCLASGNWMQVSGCLPVLCGFPLPLPHATLVNMSQATVVQTYLEVVKYDCKLGYTLTGTAGDTTRFERGCQADGSFSNEGTCLPVKCGKPPSVDSATYLDAALVFNETVTYTCGLGFTLTGQADGAKVATLTCGSDGHFFGPAPSCLPVECGPAPSLPFTTLKVNPSKMLTYSSEALTYRCNPGYSADVEDNPRSPDSDTFSIVCKPNGQFSKPPACVNINNCLVESCGAYGACVDKEPPSGLPLDDYGCQCHAGYEQRLSDSTEHAGQQDKTCKNINDCPIKDACGGRNRFKQGRGVCLDGVLGYSCQCGVGYKVAKLPPHNETCAPVVCGQPPKINNATVSSQIEEVDWDSPPVDYTCDAGFTLDGTASGKTAFQVSCHHDGAFGQLEECIPVSCGTPVAVPHSTMSPTLEELRFPVKVAYTCEDSYSLDGKSTGGTAFTVDCPANGVPTAVGQCQPMECPRDNLHLPNAYDVTDQPKYVFKQVASINCTEGYSVDGSTHSSAKSFSVTCGRLGEWGHTHECKPVECGVASSLANASRDNGIKVFPQTVTYQLEMGYTVDGSPEGATTFTVQCLANATFSPADPVLPVSCGPAPELEKATGPDISFVYQEVATFSCVHGYTISGEASGAKSFSLTCTAAGTYVGPVGCKPVVCGPVAAPAHSLQVSDANGGLLTSLEYGHYATFECTSGYSHGGSIHSALLTGNVTCQPNGKLLYPPPCLNNDDCATPENHCSPHGECVDNPVPTGTHFDDFHCACSSGFLENATGLFRTCYNVDDCPQDACKPGSCRDLVNAYECTCPPGYNAGPNEAQSLSEDCLPVSCGVPGVVKDASTQVSHEVFYAQPAVPFACNSGYSLDGSAGGKTAFTLSCLTNGTFQQPPECFPVSCGQAPDVMNANYPKGQTFVFPEAFSYTCLPGHSTDATFAPGNTEVSVSCTADGTFSTPPHCMPIECPPIPAQTSTVATHGGVVLVYEQAVTVACLAGHALDPEQHKATSYTISCDEQGRLKYSTSPHQCMPITCGPLPEVEEATVSGSPLFGDSVSVQCKTGFSLDRSTEAVSQAYEVSCQSSGSYQKTPPCLAVRCGIAAEVPKATRSSQEEQFFQGQVTYSLLEGFTTTGTADGAKSFTVTCQANGTFTPAEVPQPISCGLPPPRPNATTSPIRLVYSQMAKYACIGGHTVNGAASGAKFFNLACSALGTYVGPPGCKPVKCNYVPTPPHSLRIAFNGPVLSQLFFGQVAYFKCKPGYSKTGRMNVPPPLHFQTKCLATGALSQHSGCANIDDCEGNLCGQNGQCVDNPEPTGVHVNDYRCVCNSGFAPNMTKDGKRSCGNVPDCPGNACVPGSCHDLVNDYKCTCPPGYIEGPNSAAGLAHDCLPVSCGKPPVAENAITAAKDQEVVFDDAPVEYECKNGYTQDGSTGGETTYSIRCLDNRSFETAPQCLAVACGQAPAVEHASVTGVDLFFSDTVPYTCQSGYYVDGSATSVRSFQASCEADGQVSGVQACAPVPCPMSLQPDPFGPNAGFDAGLAMGLVFPQKLAVSCSPGFSLNKDDLRDNTYEVACKSDGTHQVPAVACTPIDCGALPEVGHATLSGSSRFGATVTARAHTGFSIDGSANPAMQSFNITCQSTGSFAGVQTFQRVNCGIAPFVAHTSRAEAPLHDTEKVYEDVVKYTLVQGYTLDGRAGGLAEFEISCQADGSFTPTQEPKPVSCGVPPSRQSATTPTASLTFSERATYTCSVGHSTDGKASGPQSFSLECSADGSFVGSDSCMPVDCGSITPPANTQQLPDTQDKMLGSLSFGQHATFQCRPGFSKDGVLYSEDLTFDVTCRPSGELFYPASCSNNDDCASPENQCSPNGQCVDNLVPTGTHADDFHCDCSSGFVQAPLNGASSVQICSNVDDCPSTACLNGTCLDEVNDYTCSCSVGFFLGANEAKGLRHDCLPVSCGKPPLVLHASALEGAADLDIDFAMDPVQYSCTPGYTLDGSPSGNPLFSLACQANKTFEVPEECLPVQCGPAPPVEHALAYAGSREVTFPESVELSFSESVAYACQSGYSLDRKTDGNVSFTVTCKADGQLMGVSQCHPVACSEPLTADTFGPSATYDVEAAKALVFPQNLEVKCMPGFALHKDEHDSIVYDVTCQADGKYSSPAHTCTQIDCGGAPPVPNGVVTGSTLFGGVLTATANTGFSLSGLVGPEFSSFTCRCLASGKFSEVQQFERISCGRAPHVPHAEEVQVEPVTSRLALAAELAPQPPRRGRGLTVRRIRSQRLLVHKRREAVKLGMQSPAELPVAVYEERVRYTCSVGYFANMRPDGKANAEDPREMVATCGADGTYQIGLPEGLHNLSCVPVTCQITQRPGVKRLEEVTFRRFSGEQLFECEEGFSLDGTPHGQVAFTEVCEAGGSFTTQHQCAEIDWCLLSQCGHGQCVNGNLSYTCQCERGYEAQLLAEFETCVQIDECVTLSGHELCGAGVRGSCVDGTLDYTCQCNAGYERFLNDDGLDSCEPVMCPALPEQPHGTSNPAAGSKMSYTQTADFYCLSGYTLNGNANGETEFQVTCLADKSYSGLQSCLPVNCGPAETAPNAVKNVSSLKYGEVAGYSCNDGYIVGGARKSFTVECQSSGVLTALQECLPVDCGRPPIVPHVLGLEQISFGQTLTATCESGYTLSGAASGLASFTVSCSANGSYAGIRQCVAVECGVPTAMSFTTMPLTQQSYPDQFEAVCDPGYSIDQDPEGSKSFMVQCAADGSFAGLQTCKPVTCDVPPTTESATAPGSPAFFGDSVTWTCKPGFSVDGWKSSATTYTRLCSSSGNFESPSPSECEDIDYCIGNPCSANGVCHDLGVGVPAPGYHCTCHEGYEVKQTPTGERCSEDDCFGQPCGDGGVCTDLSKASGVDGTYSCYCQPGYEEVFLAENRTTCRRKECLALPSTLAHVLSDGNVPRLTVATWDGRTFNSLLVPQVLQAADLATYTCSEGYSTDGSSTQQKKSLSVRCELSGELSRIPNDGDCQRVICDNLETLQRHLNADLMNPQEKYRSGDVLEFACATGHTLNAQAGGPSAFGVVCSNEGIFVKPSPTPVCMPVQCVVPLHSNALPSADSLVMYGASVQYTCMPGYEVSTITQGLSTSVVPTNFAGTCEQDGTIHFEAAVSCRPVVCGVVQPLPNAHLCIPANTQDQFMQLEPSLVGEIPECLPGVAYTPELAVTFLSPAIRVVCKQGTSIGGQGGGMTEYVLICNADKTFDGADLPACSAALHPVEGEVTDSTSASIKLADVELTFTDADGQVVARALTSSIGRYSVMLPEGFITVAGTKTGYIDSSNNFTVTESISVGGAADLSLSEVLEEGEFRIILTWGLHSRDLDSHMLFGRNFQNRVYFGRKSIRDFQLGLSAKLDRDDVDGYGPETTTLTGVGSCSAMNFCLMKFEVDNWTPSDGDIGDSQAVIKVVVGSSVAHTFTIPPSAGNARKVTIFTLDTTQNQVAVYPGDWTPPSLGPQLAGDVQQTSWASRWYQYEEPVRLDSGQVLVGLRASSTYQLSKARYINVVGASLWQCSTHMVEQGTTLQQCPIGTYIAGFWNLHNRGSPADVYVLWCCKAKSLPNEWGTCHEIDAFTKRSFECPQEGVKTALVGLHLMAYEPSDPLKMWDRAKCCEFPAR